MLICLLWHLFSYLVMGTIKFGCSILLPTLHSSFSQRKMLQEEIIFNSLHNYYSACSGICSSYLATVTIKSGCCTTGGI